MTAPTTVTPNEKRGHATLARATAVRDIRAAWAAAPFAVRVLTIGVALTAVSTGASGDAPIASGLTIAVLVPAALVDWHRGRLPDAIVLAAALTFGLVSLSATSIFGSGMSPMSVGLGVGALAGPVLILHLVRPTAMGFGDVKAAAVLGMAVGAVDWRLATWALTLAAAATALVGIVHRRSTLPFGPGLVAGTLGAIVTSALVDLRGLGFRP